jgi:L-ascorbate metabolism protein UlaG (beta-lactamase superfamily)
MSHRGKYRLADSVVVEPLVNQWSAWSHTISPLTASLHLLHYQIKTMISYLDNPESHIKMYQNPDLFGGPFINIRPERACEVAQLLADTRRRQGASIEFATNFEQFQALLVDQARGESLESYYKSIPEPLRGYVELIYDYFNRPGVRVLESLVYRSRYYDRGLQSLKLFSLYSDSSRLCFLSTPRLPQRDQIDWVVPFNDHDIDELFALDVRPQPLGLIREILGLQKSDDQRLLPLLSQDPVSFSGRGDKNKKKISIRYFGHACVLIEWNGISIMTDPFISAIPVNPGMERLSNRDLPDRINYILITHNHADHLVIEALLRLRYKTDYLVVPRTFGILIGDVSLRLMGSELGFNRIIEMDSMEEISLSDGAIIAVPFLGEHGDLAHGKTGYVVRCGNQQVLFAADSDCLDDQIYEHVCKALGPVETVFLGMECVGAPLTWVFGPILPIKMEHHHQQSRRLKGCDSKAALGLLEKVGAKRIYNYAMGLEPWMHYILGLGLSDDSIQMKEARSLLARARGRGFLAAECLVGKRELYLDPYAGKQKISFSRESKESSAAICGLSVYQEWLWHRIHSMSDATPSNLAATVALEGALQIEALEQSCNEIVRRHDILRSRFYIVGGRPVREITSAPLGTLSLTDLSALTLDRAESQATKLCVECAQRSFDLTRAPLIRVAIVILGHGRNLLLQTASAMAADSHSLQSIIRQVIEVYEDFSAARQLLSTRPPTQYDDYVRWQHQWLQSEAHNLELGYWQRQLDSPFAITGLPDQVPSVVKRLRRGEQSSFVSAELSESLRELSRRQDCSLFVTLLAAFQVLLYHYTMQDDILVATKVSLALCEAEPMIGPLTNTLVLRSDLSDNPSFLDLLSRVRNVTEAAFGHRNLPFEMLIPNSCPGSTCRQLPQVMFTLDCFPSAQIELTDLRITSELISASERSDCDLGLAAVDNGQTVSIAFAYNEEVFDQQTVSLMLRRFEVLLEQITLEPDLLLLDIVASEAPASNADGLSGVLGPTDAEDQFVF